MRGRKDKERKEGTGRSRKEEQGGANVCVGEAEEGLAKTPRA